MAIKTSSPPASKVATRSDSNASTAQRKIKDDEQAASDRSSPLSSPPALPSSPPATKARAKKANATTPKRKLKADVEGADSNGPTPSPGRAKKLALLKTFSASPFPGFERPSAEECRDVHDRLSTVHGTPKRPEALVDDPNGRAGCGEVPDVLDALIRTTLSQNTTSKNSTAAKRKMDEQYGRANHRAVLEGGLPLLQKTIACGGMGNMKGKTIYNIMKMLDEREGGKGNISLDYLHKMEDKEALAELVSFDGIGVKTASCVLLFCLSRESFAVDTHVFRLARSLGWIPPKATRDTAFQHLDLYIPDDLKYGLHVLLVSHGRGCEKCAAGSVSMNFVESCPINDIVKREPRKAGKRAKTGKAGPSKEEHESDGGAEEVEEAKPGPSQIEKDGVDEKGSVQPDEPLIAEDSSNLPAGIKVKAESSTPRKRTRGASTGEAPASPATRRKTKVKQEGAMHGLDV